MNDDLYFSEETQDNQEGSVEEQLSIMKAIFLGGKSTVIELNTSFKLKCGLFGLVFFHLLLAHFEIIFILSLTQNNIA